MFIQINLVSKALNLFTFVLTALRFNLLYLTSSATAISRSAQPLLTN